MAEQLTERALVAAPTERCFAVAIDFERYPEWASEVVEVVVLERDRAGRGTCVAFRAAALGRSARYTLAYDYAGAPGRLSWQLVESDVVSRLDGSYEFEPDDGDTLVTYRLAVELAVPVPAFVRRRAEDRITHTALTELRERAES